MFSIGAFAHMSGLSTKTLRYYHDRGLLVPARVDPVNGYRTYTLAQVDDAVRIAVLRRGGMPLEQVGEVLDNPDRAASLIERFHDTVRQRRQNEDNALISAASAVSKVTIAAEAREMPTQPYAASTTAIQPPHDDDDVSTLRATSADVDRRAGWLREALTGVDVTATGVFWTTLGVRGDLLTVTPHWPLPHTADLARVDSIDEEIHCGVLPARTEAFIEIPLPADDGDASVQLAMAAVLSAVDERVPDPRTLRQTVFPDRARVEFAVSLTAQA